MRKLGLIVYRVGICGSVQQSAEYVESQTESQWAQAISLEYSSSDLYVCCFVGSFAITDFERSAPCRHQVLQQCDHLGIYFVYLWYFNQPRVRNRIKCFLIIYPGHRDVLQFLFCLFGKHVVDYQELLASSSFPFTSVLFPGHNVVIFQVAINLERNRGGEDLICRG